MNIKHKSSKRNKNRNNRCKNRDKTSKFLYCHKYHLMLYISVSPCRSAYCRCRRRCKRRCGPRRRFLYLNLRHISTSGKKNGQNAADIAAPRPGGSVNTEEPSLCPTFYFFILWCFPLVLSENHKWMTAPRRPQQLVLGIKFLSSLCV